MALVSRIIPLFALFVLLGLVPSGPATAQSQYAPAIRVNDLVITNFELDQRRRFLTLLRAPGNPSELAREQLINERLQLSAANHLGLEISDEEVLRGMEEFAARANLSAEEFVKALAQGGVDATAYRDFVRAGVTWRELIRAKFGRQVSISEAELSRAKAALQSEATVRVLLTEIILNIKEGNEARLRALAEQLSGITTQEEFESAARRYSNGSTAQQGGKVNWLSAESLPPAVRGPVLGLNKAGQVTRPIVSGNTIALFQLREREAVNSGSSAFSKIDYAAYYIAGGRTAAALAQAEKIRARVDTCDDLYGVAQGQPEEVLERDTKTVGDIPADIAAELARLDNNEVSTALTRGNGQTLVFLMLCERTNVLAETTSDETIMPQLRNQRLSGHAAIYMQELRERARIVEQ